MIFFPTLAAEDSFVGRRRGDAMPVVPDISVRESIKLKVRRSRALALTANAENVVFIKKV